MNCNIPSHQIKTKNNQCLFLNSCKKIKQEMLAAIKGWKYMKNKDCSIGSILSMSLKSLFYLLALHLINVSKLNIINVLWQLIPDHFVFPPLTLPKFLASFLMFRSTRKYISGLQKVSFRHFYSIPTCSSEITLFCLLSLYSCSLH